MDGPLGGREGTALDELPLLHQPALVDRRWDGTDDHTSITSKLNARSSPPTHDASNQFVGILERPPTDFQLRAVEQWTAELKELLSKGESEFINLLHRRTTVQLDAHNAAIASQNRRKKTKGRGTKLEVSETHVPAILRLGVLTMFPLIEALSTIPGANYDKLCAQTLDIVIKTVATLPTLALSREPSDCLDAFKDFISKQIESNQYSIDTQAKSQALVALASLSLSQGKAQNIFHLLDVLFKVHFTSKQGSPSISLPVGASLRQLLDYSHELDVPVPLELLDESPWNLDLLLPTSVKYNSIASRQSDSFSFVTESQATSSIATDGKYLYIQSSHGLAKVGTGLHHTIKGHYYAANPSWRTADRWNSLVCINDKLYYWSPDLSYETYRPNKSMPSKPENAQPAAAAPNTQPAPPLPRVCHVIIILSTETLQPIGKVRVDGCSLSMQSRMISDGKYLMFVGKQRGKGTKSSNPTSIVQLQQQQQQQIPASTLLGGGSFPNSVASLPGQFSLGQPFVFGNNIPSGERPPDFGGFSFGNPVDNGLQFRAASPHWNPSGMSFNNEQSEYESIVPVPFQADSQLQIQQVLQQNRDESSSDDEDEDDEDGSDVSGEDDEENEEGNESQQDDEDENDEDLYDQEERSPPRRRSTSANRASRNRQSGHRVKEEDDAVTNIVCVEWFDVNTPFSAPPPLNESTATVAELATIPVISPVRSLELLNRTTFTNTPQGGIVPIQTDELLPPNFGFISFYTNGHHLVAVTKLSAAPFRVYSLIDGKPLPDVPAPSGSPGRQLDPRDTFVYDALSNSVYSFRAETAKCSRFHNMGLVPHYADSQEDGETSAMQVDTPTNLSASTSSKGPSYTFPHLPPLSPEVILSKLDVWSGAPKKSRVIGVAKQTSVVTERTLKDNLTPMECVSVIAASVDRLARHHWAYASQSVVDESHQSHLNDFNFTVGASVDTLRTIYAIIEHAISLVINPIGLSSESAGHILLSFLRSLKVNLHFFNTSGKASSLKDDQNLVTDLRNMLLKLTYTPGLSKFEQLKTGSQRLDNQIRREACDALCVGFFNLLPNPSAQIDFLKVLTEESINAPHASPLHHKLVTSLSGFYRIHELLLEDPKVMMDVDQDSSKPKKTSSIAASSSNASGGLGSSSGGIKDKPDSKGPLGRDLPFHAQASSLITLLLRKSLEDTTIQLERVFSTQNVGELKTLRLTEFGAGSTLRLLIALQMEIVNLSFSKSLVIQYFDSVSKAVGGYLDVMKRYPLDEPLSSSPAQMEIEGGASSVERSPSPASSSSDSIEDPEFLLRRAQWKASHVVLESSVIGTLLPSLIQALANPKRHHIRDPLFVVSAFEKLCNLLVGVDNFNQSLAMVAKADVQIQLRSGSARKLSGSDSGSNANDCESNCWLLDLQSSLALLARKCVVTLLEGEPTSEKERQCQDWLDTRLINGGIDENPQNLEKTRWLEAFAEGKEAAALYTWIKEQGGSRPHARPSAKMSLERAERYALAAMMKHAGLIDDAISFSKSLAQRSPLSGSHVGRFSFIAKKSTALASLLTRRAEMQKAWQLAVQDKVNDFDVFSEMVQRPDRLLDFCEMHGVEANLVNTDDTIKRLMQKLQEEIAVNESLKKAGNLVPTDIFENLCAPVVERAIFLLKLLPSNRTVKHPAADSTNPFSSNKSEANRLRASAPGSSEGAGRGHLTKSMSHLPTTESAQAKIKQRESEVQDSQSFSQRVGELRSWLQAYSEWEQTVLLHNRTKRDEPPPTSPIQGVIAFTTNQSITVKDWERVLRVQAVRAKSREQGLIYLHRLLRTCHFAAPRHQLLGSLSVTHYLDGIQSSGQALTTKVTDLFGELFIALAGILKDTTLDSTSRLLALNVCAISYTENDALLLSRADIFQLLHQVMSEPAPETSGVTAEYASILRAQHRALHDATWTCFRLFAAQAVSWRHHDDLHFERAIMTKLQQQAFDVFLLQLKSFSEKLVTHDLNDWERDILVLEPHAGHEFAFELVFLLRLLSEASKSWTSPDSVPTLLKFLSSRTAPRAQRVVLRLLRKLLPSGHSGNKQLVQFCLDEMGKWIFQGKCTSSEPQKKKLLKTEKDESSSQAEKALDGGDSNSDKTSTLSVLSSTDSMEHILSSGTLDSSTMELFRNAHNTEDGQGRRAPRKVQASSLLSQDNHFSSGRSSNQTKPLPHEDALRIASIRAKFGDIVQVHEGNGAADLSAGAKGKNASIMGLNPVYWADGGAASMLASEYIALLRYLCTPSHPAWLLAVRESVAAALSELPSLVAAIASDPETLSKSQSESLFRSLSALCLLSGFPEPIRVGCKVVVNAPVVSQTDRVTGTVVAYSAPATNADVILDSESVEHQTVHTLDVKQLQAIPEIEIDQAHLAAISSALIPFLLAVITYSSPLDTVTPLSTDGSKQSSGSQSTNASSAAASSSMDVDAPANSQDSLHASSADTVAVPNYHHQNVWLYQELKAKAISALNSLLQHPDSVDFVVKHCSDKIPTLLQLAQKADSTTFMEKVERQIGAIASRLWDVQTIPSDLEGRSRRSTQGESRGMSEALPHFWNANKANALPTGLDKTSLAPGTVILDDEARTIQLHGLRSGNPGHSASFGRPSRGGLSRFGGSSHKDQGTDVTFMFGNCLIPSRGMGQYYFELQIHGENAVERPPGAPSKPHISIGLVPDPQTSGPTTASTTSSSSYRQSSYRGGNDSVSMPFPPGSYCYLSTRNKAWVSDGNLRTDGYGEHFGYGSVVGCLWDQNERTITFTKDGEELDVAFRNVLAGSGDSNSKSASGPSSSPDRLVPCVSACRGVQFTVNFGQTPFRFSPVLDDALDAAAREAKRKEAEEKRQKAIQEEMAKRKAEQEQREAIFNEDASLLLSMGFCPRHALRAMMHAGWTYKNRWLSQEGVLMAANWLTEASPDQLGPAGDLPSESAPAAEEAPKPVASSSSASKKKLSKSADKSSSKSAEATPTSDKDSGSFKKPTNPEGDYSPSKSTEYILGDAYSLGAPRRTGVTLASIWRRDILPLVTSDIPFPANDPTVNQLIAYAEAGNEDALKSNLSDLYNGKIPSHIRLPSQLKIVETETTSLKMTQITPDMVVQISGVDRGSHLAKFVGKSGTVLDRDLKYNLVLVQFTSSEDGSLEEWWFHVSQLAKDRAPTRPYINIQDASILQSLLASKTQQFSYFAARRALLSLLRHAPLAFDVARAKRDLEELALAALNAERMDVTPSVAPSASATSSDPESSSSSNLAAPHTVSGAIDVQDAVQLMSREYLASPETLISSMALFRPADSNKGMNLAGTKLVELLTRVVEQQGSEACTHLLNALMQKCIGLLDLSCFFTNSKTLTFTHHDSLVASGSSSSSSSSGSSSKKGSSSSSQKEQKEESSSQEKPQQQEKTEGVFSMPNYLHKVHIPGARACLVIFHAETDRGTRLNVYLDEDLSDCVNSMGGLFEMDAGSASKYSAGGPFQPVLVPTNTFWIKGRQSTQAANAFSFGGDSGKASLEYKVTIVPVSSDIALGRWLAEFLTLSTSTGELHVPIDFNPLLNTLIDFLYITSVPSALKESVMALLTRIIHELRRRARGQSNKLCQLSDPIGQPLDLSRLNTLKREMISLYDNERRSSSNGDNTAVKKRGSVFTTYLQSLVELMISVRLYDIEKNARQKLLQDLVPQSFASGAADETMKVAVALAQSLASEAKLGSSPSLFASPSAAAGGAVASSKEDDFATTFALFTEEDMPEGPMKIPAEGEEDSSTTSSEGSSQDDEAAQQDKNSSSDADKASGILDLFASSGHLPAPSSSSSSSNVAASSSSSSDAAAPSGSPKKERLPSLARVDDLASPKSVDESIDMADQGGFNPVPWGGFGNMDDMEIDDELAQAIALSMRDQGGDEAPSSTGAVATADSDDDEDDSEGLDLFGDGPSKPEEKKAEKKPSEDTDKKPSEDKPSDKKPVDDKKKEESNGEPQPPSTPPSAPPASGASSSSMDVDRVPPPPPPPSSTSTSSVRSTVASLMSTILGSPKTPDGSKTPSMAATRKPAASSTPAVSDPSWFATLVAAAQALENYAAQIETGTIPALSPEAVLKQQQHQQKPSTEASSSAPSSASSMQVDETVPTVDPLCLQFVKDSVRTAWNNTRSSDFVRHRLFLLDHIPSVELEKRAELVTALEELVEEKALVVDGSLYLPVDYSTKRTKTWMVVEVQSTDNMPSFFTFKDPNFTANKPLRIDAVPIRRLIEKSSSSTPKPNAISTPANKSSTTAESSSPAATAPLSAATSGSAPSEVKQVDLHFDEPDTSTEPFYAHVDERWREYIRSRLWDKKGQHLTREFRDALTETFLRFCSDHTLNGVLGKSQLNALQAAAGGEPISDSGFDFFFGFGTKTHTFVAGPKPHPGKSIFFLQDEIKSNARKVMAQSSATSASNAMEVDQNSASSGPATLTETGLTLDAFLTLYTNQALQMPMTTLEELTHLGFDLHLNRTTFQSLDEAESAVLDNEFLSPKSDVELLRYMEQLMSEVDVGSPLQMTISHVKSISMESHLAQLFPRLVRLSTPLLCLRYEMLRQLNQKVNEVFPLINMGSRGAGYLASWISECRGLIFHSLKMNFVYNVLERTADESTACPSIILNRIDISANKDHVMATRTEDAFTKNTAFGQAFTQLQTTDPVAFRRPKPIGAEPHFAMRVLFQKENVQGDGGPYRQFFTDISKELAEVLPLLVPCPNAQTKIGNNRDKFVVTPSSNSRTYLKMFRFLGQLMGMAMRTGVMLSIDLPSFFWKPLVGLTPQSQDIRDIDHSFHTVLKYLKTCSPEVFEGESRTIFDHFQTTLSDKSKTLLKPGGDSLEVTYDNRLEYCRLAEAARCNESSLQMAEIRRGLADFVPLSLLSMFTWQDLQWRVCGRPQIDLKLLKRHTEYAEGLTPTTPHIRYFWQVLRSFSQEDRRAFVRFAWAQERLPADDQEFARSQTRMMIKQGPTSDQVFPTADTCFFNLSLPVYSSPDILRERLLFAIHTDGAMDNDRPNHGNDDR